MISQNIRESPIIEFKEADFLNPNNSNLRQQYWKLIKRICGFANNLGGYLILGLSEDSNSYVNSITPLHQDRQELINRIRGLTVSHTIPAISIKIRDVNVDPNELDKFILIIQISESPEPVMYINSQDKDSNKYFFRYNEDTIAADHATVRLLFSKKNIEERLSHYLKSRNYGLTLRNCENVTSWISIPYQFPLETFDEINNATIRQLRVFFNNPNRHNRFYGIHANGRFSHKGVLFFYYPSYQELNLFNGYLEVNNNGYIEFKAEIKVNNSFLSENFIIQDFNNFISFLYNFYSHYEYFGDIKVILSIKKSRQDYKLGITDFQGAIIHATPNNFSLNNRIHIERVILVKELESENYQSQISEGFKIELHHCFGIE